MNSNSLSRRHFAKRIAAASIVTQTISHSHGQAAQADEPTEVGLQTEENVNRKNSRSEDAPTPPPIDILLTEVIRQRYPDERLTAGILNRIRGDLRTNFMRSRILGGFPLKNSDQPSFEFAAWRSDATDSQ